tara:strand:- start:2871 stop:4850 length:1980 start_codon:yes stop_codon:yes gene_type:complete
MALLNPLQRQQKAYEDYAKNPNNKGLGAQLRSLFAAEGPESAGTFVNIPGADFNPGGRMAAMMELGGNLNFKNQDALEGYLEDIAGRTMGYDGVSIPVEGLVPDEGGLFGGGGPFMSEGGQQFGFGDEDISELEKARREIQDNAFKLDPIGNLNQKALLEKQTADSGLAAREMLGEEAAFESSGLDDIGAILASLNNTENVQNPDVTEGEVDSIDNLIAESATSAADKARIAANAADEDTVMGQSLTPAAIEGGFQAGMKDYMDAAGIDDTPKKGETKEEALERYQKEFSDATGLDASGKVDKSRALMAFGLALMQNKAGKGFNVGKLLTSVSEAGQAALPALDKATADAKAARISAGKYALQQIKSDEDASSAVRASSLAYAREIAMEELKAENKIREEIAKAKLEGQNFDIGEGAYTTKFKIGSEEVGIRRAVNPNTGRSIYVDPSSVVNSVTGAYNKTLAGLETINQMNSLIDTLDAARSDTGGTTGKLLLDRAQGVLSSMGLGSPESFFSDVDALVASGELPKEFKGMSVESGSDTLRRALILRFKRFMSQETGNGISNVDVENLEGASGKFAAFTNVNESRGALSELRTLFTGSLNTLDDEIARLSDPKQYLTYGNDNYLYDETMSQLQTALNKNSPWRTATTAEGVTTFNVGE